MEKNEFLESLKVYFVQNNYTNINYLEMNLTEFA